MNDNDKNIISFGDSDDNSRGASNERSPVEDVRGSVAATAAAAVDTYEAQTTESDASRAEDNYLVSYDRFEHAEMKDDEKDSELPQDENGELNDARNARNTTEADSADDFMRAPLPEVSVESVTGHAEGFAEKTISDVNPAKPQAAPSPEYRRFEAPSNSRQIKNGNPRYVTKGALAFALVVTMLLSSVFGAFLGSMFIGRSDSSNGLTSSQEDSGSSKLSLASATGSKLTVAEIVEKNENAVVEIVVSGTAQNMFGQTELTEGAGSGVIVNKDGYIVTNYHVIEGANKVTVTLHNGESHEAKIIGGDSDNDIAVIKIAANDLTVAEIGDSSKVNVGDLAVAIGNPLGQLGGTATTGIISALDRRLNIDNRTLTLMQTDAAINQGNSGGGLFNGYGQLIGIVDAKSSGSGIEGLAFAIPINSVTDIINDLITTGKVSGKPVIGVMIQDVSEKNSQYYGVSEAGVYVADVTGKNAKEAGFMAGDRIVSINGKEITSASDLVSRVRENKIGDTISVVISRNGQQIEIKTVLEESTSNE